MNEVTGIVLVLFGLYGVVSVISLVRKIDRARPRVETGLVDYRRTRVNRRQEK
jgi:hypothetical protein